jgi:hypothetical protein
MCVLLFGMSGSMLGIYWSDTGVLMLSSRLNIEVRNVM